MTNRVDFQNIQINAYFFKDLACCVGSEDSLVDQFEIGAFILSKGDDI
jgi:hypothetical protein